ncbi:ribonuclease H-like domain-containing protein [Mycena leptocephala]|nr:ribonuclease H-like domain-containing protein [Mycena leptocephala]
MFQIVKAKFKQFFSMSSGIRSVHPEPCTAVSGSLFPRSFTVHYLTTEAAVDSALRHIVDGVIGFDTEFVKRLPTVEEAIIESTFDLVGGNRKAAILGWQMIELAMRKPFPYAWDTMGLRVVQVAKGDVAWVINLGQVKAYPRELRRILTSPHIKKVGVGLVNDIPVIWNDLRSELRCLVDSGLMARLLLAESHPVGGFQNISMEECAAKILGFRVDKSQQVSDWAQPLTPEQIQYAGTDAIVALRLYEKLVVDLEARAVALGRDIPIGWYGFNSRMGEPTRLRRNVAGEEVVWSTKDYIPAVPGVVLSAEHVVVVEPAAGAAARNETREHVDEDESTGSLFLKKLQRGKWLAVTRTQR